MLKGPVIGPLVICGVCYKKNKLNYLNEIGVKDSKKLTSNKRRELSEKIISSCYSYKIIIIDPKEIDEREKDNITMNRLEEIKFAEILNYLKPDIIYLDAADVNEERFGNSIKNLLNYRPKEIISKHKADDLYPIVSAASIVAKYERDSIIDNLKQKYGDFGSGYPSDKKTIDFLREYIKKNKKAPPFARKSWETTKKILREEIEIKKITDFF
ncbi:MAG: ribonuclease HII [Promethearchaeia archaeon]